MSNIRFDGANFIVTDQEGDRVLLNCRDYLSNKSAVSMHRFPNQTFQTIPELILGLTNKARSQSENDAFLTMLLDTLLAARLIRSRDPVRFLEYGSGDGRASWHLAEMLGTFHRESSLVCVWDSFAPEWMERMADVQTLPKVSFFSGDFGELEELKDHWFDIVFLNGTANFERPDKILRDALRLVSPDGAVWVLTDETPLLESTFKLCFEAREEYEITPSNKVLIANAKDCVWQLEGL